MIRTWRMIPVILMVIGCTQSIQEPEFLSWDISILPSSIRLDPSTNEIIENRFIVPKNNHSRKEDILKKNWVFKGDRAELYGARGEYVSFQLVLTNNSGSPLKGINIEMPPFKNGDSQFTFRPQWQHWLSKTHLLFELLQLAPHLHYVEGL